MEMSQLQSVLLLQLLAQIFSTTKDQQNSLKFYALISRKCFHRYEFKTVRYLQQILKTFPYFDIDEENSSLSYFESLLKDHQTKHKQCVQLSTKNCEISPSLFQNLLFAFFEEGLRRHRNCSHIAYILSILYLEKEMFKESIKMIDKISKLKPDFQPYFLWIKAKCLYLLNYHNEAQICIQTMLQRLYPNEDLNSLISMYLWIRAEMYRNECNYSLANIKYEQALKRSNNVERQAKKCLYQSQRVMLVLNQQQAYQISWHDELWLVNTDDILHPDILLDTRQHVLSIFRHFGQSSHIFNYNINLLIILQYRLGNYSKAIEYCKKIPKEHKKNMKFCAFVAELYNKANDITGTQKFLYYLKLQRPCSIDGRILIIKTLKKCGKRHEALPLAFQLERQAFKSVENFVKLIELFDLLHQFTKVLQLVEQMREDYPQQTKQVLVKQKLRVFEMIASHKVGELQKATFLYVQICSNLVVQNSSQYFNLLKVVHFSFQINELQKGRIILMELNSFLETLPDDLIYRHHLSELNNNRKL